MDIRNTVIKCLSNVGIVIECDAEDVNINDYNVDSITFISFIVDIENELGIEIPDGYLYSDILQSLNGFLSLVQQLIETNARKESREV